MERDARLAFFYQDQQFTIAVHEHHRQARGAVNQDVSESSENYKVVMMQKFPMYSALLEGRLEDNERRVAQVTGSEARDAPRGQRSHKLHEHQVLLKAGGKQK